MTKENKLLDVENNLLDTFSQRKERVGGGGGRGWTKFEKRRVRKGDHQEKRGSS